MIIESRSIIFSDEELVIALRPVLEGKGESADFIPEAIITDLDDEGDVIVRFEKSEGSVEFSSKELGAAVLNHCIEVGIPLPRGSYKELALRGDHVALIVRLETGTHQGDFDESEE